MSRASVVEIGSSLVGDVAKFYVYEQIFDSKLKTFVNILALIYHTDKWVIELLNTSWAISCNQACTFLERLGGILGEYSRALVRFCRTQKNLKRLKSVSVICI